MVEVLVAIAISGIAILLLFTVYRTVHSTAIVREKKLASVRECWSAYEAIRSAIARSNKVLSEGDNHWVLYGKDTMHLKLNDGTLRINEKEILGGFTNVDLAILPCSTCFSPWPVYDCDLRAEWGIGTYDLNWKSVCRRDTVFSGIPQPAVALSRDAGLYWEAQDH